jgi:hypothetical protein
MRAVYPAAPVPSRAASHGTSCPPATSRSRGSTSAPAPTSASATPTWSPRRWTEPWAAQPSGASDPTPARAFASAAREQGADELCVAEPRGVVEHGAGRRAADDAPEVEPGEIDDEVRVAAERRDDEHLLRIRIEGLGQRLRGALAARDRAQRQVLRLDVRRRAELREHLRLLVTAADDRLTVRRAKRHVSAPELAAGAVELGAVLREQPQERGTAPAADRVCEDRPLVRVHPGLEQQPDVLEPVLVEGVPERVRAAGLGAGREQQAQALGALGLGRVVDRLPVVRIRSGREEQPSQLGVVLDARGAVERRHRAVLVPERGVRVGAALEEPGRDLRRVEARVARVEERRPSERPAGLLRVALPRPPERERGPGVVGEPGV